MRYVLKCLVFMLAAWVVSTTASAGPTLVYMFNVTAYECIEPGSPLPNSQCQDPPPNYSHLNSMAIGIDSSVLPNGARLVVDHHDHNYPAIYLDNDGIRFLALAGGVTGGTRQALLSAEEYAIAYYLFQLTAEFSPNGGGSIDLLTEELELEMGDTGVLDSFGKIEWTGILKGDQNFEYYQSFKGHWNLVGVVSEPGTLALVVLALAGFAVTARRRRIY